MRRERVRPQDGPETLQFRPDGWSGNYRGGNAVGHSSGSGPRASAGLPTTAIGLRAWGLGNENGGTLHPNSVSLPAGVRDAVAATSGLRQVQLQLWRRGRPKARKSSASGEE